MIEQQMSNIIVDDHEVIDAIDNTLRGMKRDFMQISPIISRMMLTDVQGHFAKGQGPIEQWKNLKKSYTDRYGEKNRRSYLYKTGKLLRGIKTNPLKTAARITVVSNYARIHNFGGSPDLNKNKNMPKREYFYLSEDAWNKIIQLYSSFISGKWAR